MGQDRLDNKVKKVLSERKIQPNQDSWNKLEALLDTKDERPKRNYAYYAIAASVMLLLGMLFFLNSNKEQEQETQLVNETENEIKTIPDSGLVINDENEETNVVEATETVENAIASEDKTINNEQIDKQSIEKKSVEVKQNRRFAENQKKVEKEEVKEQNRSNPLIKNEVNLNKTSLAENEKKKQDSLALNNEVDALLALAQENLKKETKTENTINTTTTALKVNPDALLTEVEEEAEESFRAKVFEAVKKGFKKTKTAVATRNDN